MFRKAVLVVYVVVGLVVANSHHYFSHLSGVGRFISAILAVGLWPLILVGVNLHMK